MYVCIEYDPSWDGMRGRGGEGGGKSALSLSSSDFVQAAKVREITQPYEKNRIEMIGVVFFYEFDEKTLPKRQNPRTENWTEDKNTHTQTRKTLERDDCSESVHPPNVQSSPTVSSPK